MDRSVNRVGIEVKNRNGLRYMFQINEAQSNPEILDMTSIIPTIDMSMMGHALLDDTSKYLSCDGRTTSSVAGVQSKTFKILSYGNAVGADTQIVVPLNHHFVVWGVKILLYTNVAGAGVINNKWISIELELLTGSVPICKYQNDFTGNSLRQQYQQPLDRSNLQVVPCGCTLQLSTWIQDGTNFPANTSLQYTLVGQAVPSGAPLPLGV